MTNEEVAHNLENIVDYIREYEPLSDDFDVESDAGNYLLSLVDQITGGSYGEEEEEDCL